jgi:hypothetical protein
LCREIFKCTPDDERIENMNVFTKLWMYEHWLADQKDDAELAKNHAYLVGSFFNPEAVKKLLGEGVNTHVSTDEDFEKSTALVKKATVNNSPRKRKKKLKV